MTVTPSCPALLVHADDAFRQSLIAQLDQKHFSVTYTSDPAEAKRAIEQKSFKVIIVALDGGLDLLAFLDGKRLQLNGTGVLIIGEANAELRRYARVADETLLKPVDAQYVAERARVYCRH